LEIILRRWPEISPTHVRRLLAFGKAINSLHDGKEGRGRD
jgi:hypothetical protein